MDEKYVLHGPAPLIPISKDSVGKQLYESLLKNINLSTAFIDAVTSESISWETFVQQSCRLAESLKKCGIAPSDTIAICSENNLEFFIPLVAAMYLGVIVTTFSHHYTVREILHVAKISKPKVVFCSKSTLNTVLEAKKELECIQKVIIMEARENYDNCELFNDFICNNSNPQFDITNFKPIQVNTTEHVALILYSSGTTGMPKGVMLTHNNINTVMAYSKDPRYNVIQHKLGSDVILGLLPFYHAYGLSTGLSSLINGRQTVVLKTFDPEIFLKTIQHFKISTLAIAPPLANFLAKSPLVNNYDLSSIKLIICGAAVLSKSIEKSLRQRLELKWFRQGYGMTETTLSVLGLPLKEYRAGSCGKVLPRTSAKVIDPNTGKTLGPGQIGEFHFKGSQIMKGYADNIEATQNVMNENGWLVTGDLGYYDEDGYFYIIDRLKELIKYKGFQVPPAELEAILLTHPKIVDAAVVGLPDKLAGELPLAFVVKELGQKLSEHEVINFVAKQVSPQKHLRGGVRFVTEIPKNPSGKILRRELRKLIQTQKSKL